MKIVYLYIINSEAGEGWRIEPPKLCSGKEKDEQPA